MDCGDSSCFFTIDRSGIRYQGSCTCLDTLKKYKENFTGFILDEDAERKLLSGVRELSERIGELEKQSEFRRALIERAYVAALKPNWEEGECLEEILEDMEWAAIGEPRMIREATLEERNEDG